MDRNRAAGMNTPFKTVRREGRFEHGRRDCKRGWNTQRRVVKRWVRDRRFISREFVGRCARRAHWMLWWP